MYLCLFKQNTAYEMRIRDWSSDVCSSDLPAQRSLWQALSAGSDDPLLRQDAMRVAGVLAMRAADQNWADSVAGDMERHYSPGRTWEALARSVLPLFETGDVLDIASGDGVLAELLAPPAHRYVCIDSSQRVVSIGRAHV